MAPFRIVQGKIVEWISSILVIVMVIAIFIQVVNRYVFNRPISWTEELARFIFIWITLLGAFLALRSKAHISIHTFMDRFSPEVKVLVSGVISFLTVYYLFYLILFGAEVIQGTWESFSPAMEISYSYVHAAIPICAAMMVIYLSVQIYSLKWRTAIVSGIISMALSVGLFVLFGGGRFSGGTLVLLMAVCLVILISAGMPIAFCMGVASSLFLILYQKVPLLIANTRMVGSIDSFPLLAVPFFVLAGELMNIGGVTVRLVNLSKVIVGGIRGGLGMVVVVGEYFFSGISGSSIADVSAIGSLLIPAMKKAGFTSANTVSIVSAATAMGVLVPPCILMVVLGGMTGISVGALFAGGFLPAIILAICIMVLIYIQAVKANLAIEPRLSLRESLKAMVGAIIPLMLPVIIFGGILSGAATATEVSVIAVVYGFIIGVFIYREIKIDQIIPILVRTAITTGTVMFLVGTSSVLAWVFSTNLIPQKVGELVVHVSTSPLMFLLLANITFIIIGSVLEGLPALLILIPIFLPIATQLGINPLHFGILSIASIGIGIFLPPIGIGMFIACTFAEIDIGKVIVPFIPYFIVLLVGLFVISYVPWFTLVIPNLFFTLK